MKRFFLLFTCVLITTVASARFTALCDIQYKTQNGWSDKYRAKVIFLSGCEMQPQQYSNEVYVAIWFSEEECAIIKLDATHISVNFRMKDLNLFIGLSHILMVNKLIQNMREYGV